MPEWVDDSIEGNSDDDNAGCISEEGWRQINLLFRIPDKQREISRAIHALIYKANDLDLLDHPNVQEFVLNVVCKSNVADPYPLRFLFYIQ